MIPRPPVPESRPARRGGFSVGLAGATFLYTSFVLGGLLFGWLFVSNWRLLISLPQPQVIVRDGQIVVIPAAPGAPSLPISIIPRPAAAPAAEKPSAKPKVETDLPEWVGTDRINFLLLGIDHRDGEPVESSRSDTMMLVSVDPRSKSAVMVSLPRDMWVNIPGFYPQRINVAHSVGGPVAAARTVEANFGVRIHHWARVNFRGFEQLIDALGGVIVDVERPIKDDQYPIEGYGVARVYVAPGPQMMDGPRALQYARSRHSENDFGRARRQQKVLVAARERALQLNMLPKLPTLIGVIQKNLSTDVSVPEMLALASLGAQIDRDRIVNVVIDANMVSPFMGSDGANLLEPNRPLIQRAIQQAFAQASGQPKLEILNGTDRRGVARQVADQLAAQGFEVQRFADADRPDYAKTQVIVYGEDERFMRSARALAGRLRVPESDIQMVPEKPGLSDVRIILGRDYLR
jgi:LCP family protein required for cell wall assembly